MSLPKEGLISQYLLIILFSNNGWQSLQDVFHNEDRIPVDTADSVVHGEDEKSTQISSKVLLKGEDLLVGRSQVIRQLHATIRKAALRKSPVLIHGKTGTGKELVAQAIHLESRRIGPFVPVNVAAISEGLFESELFGHVRGSFTGAWRDQAGLIRKAARGTLFLDEIGELSLPLQAKLLRVLDTREVWPVGADCGIGVDVQIIAATNADLRALVAAGRFRADLWYRLCGIKIYVRPLRERVDDVPLLAEYFAKKIANEYAETQMIFSRTAIEMLQRYDWPGNVRELREVVGRLTLEESPLVTDIEVRRALQIEVSTAAHGESSDNIEYERLAVLLQFHNGNVLQVASALNVVPSTVYRRMRRLGMKVDGRGRKAGRHVLDSSSIKLVV